MNRINRFNRINLGNGAKGDSLLPETKAYQTRVVDDDGEILDIKQLNEDIKSLKGIGNGSLWAKFYQLLIAHGGVTRIGGLVQKWYDVISNKDVTQIVTAEARPTPFKVGELWEMRFDGNDWLSGAYGESLEQPHTRALGIKSNALLRGSGSYCDGLDASELRGYVGLGAAGTGRVRIAAGYSLDTGDSVVKYPSVIVAVFNGTSSVVFQNGVQINNGSAGTHAVNGLNLAKNATAVSYGNHVIWFFVQLKSGQEMTATEANGFGAWAKSRYNIDYTVR